MTGTRVRWQDEAPEDGTVLAWTGYIGTLDGPAFKIYAPDDEHDNWLLAIQLTIGGTQFRYADDPDELKAVAETWLERFVSSLGAVFPRPAKTVQRPGKRQLTDTDVLDAFRTVTNWSDAEVLHYESCDQCNPEAGLVCDVIAAELAAAYREAGQ